MSCNTAMSKNEGDLVLRDLQSVLRESLGDDVIVVEYSTTNLLPIGENYGSTILKVDSLIKRNASSPEEKLHLVAKMTPTGEFQQTHLDVGVTFKKEIFVFKELVPALRDLQKELGVAQKDLINILPKYYGSRLSMNRDKLDVADEDVVMLMKNLKEDGYYTMNRMLGLDLEHAKLAITQLARFHAWSMVMSHKKPDFFKKAKEVLNTNLFRGDPEEFTPVINHTLAIICEDPRIAKYQDRIRTTVEANKDWGAYITDVKEHWISIVHGDFWVNNVMFLHENGKIEDVKLIDFQMTMVSSPMKDLPYFMCTSIQMDVVKNCFDELLDIYYNTFIEVLARTDCDMSLYNRENFEEQLKIDAGGELFRCFMASKFFTQDTEDENVDHNDMFGSVLMGKASNLFLERSWMIVSKYVDKGWI